MLPLPGAGRARGRAAAPPRLTVEALEDRTVPAVVEWTGLVNNDWNNGQNWNTLSTPDGDDDVLIIGAGPAVRFSGVTVSVRSLTCDRELHIDSGRLTVSAISVVATLRLEDGELRANAATDIGVLVWEEGTLSGTGTVTAGFSLSLIGDDDRTLKTTLVNSNLASWHGGEVEVSGNGKLINASGATFVAYTSETFEPAFTNNGRFFNFAITTATFGSFTNSGEVHLVRGTMRTTGTFTQSAGSFELEGGAFSSSRTLVLNGGALGGAGTIFASLRNSGGQVAPSLTDGAPHRLTIQGNYTQNSGGRLALLLRGPAATGDFDQLVVSGQATLAGRFEVTQAGAAAAGDSYSAVSAGSVTGQFGQVAVTAPAGMALTTQYTSAGVNLVTAGVAATPPISPTPPPAPPAEDGGTLNVVINNVEKPPSSPPAPPRDGGAAGQGAGGAGEGAAPRDGGAAVTGVVSAAGTGGATGGVVFTSSAAPAFVAGTARGFEAAVVDPAGAAAGGWANTPGVMGGDRSTAPRPDPGLAEELFALLPVALPEAELPGEGDLEAAGDLAAALLGTGRARTSILPQAGSQLSVIAALVTSDDGGDDRPALGAAELDELFLHPLERAGEAAAPLAAEARAWAPPGPGEAPRPERAASLGSRMLFGTLVSLTGLVSLVLGPRRRRRTAVPLALTART